MSQEYTLTYSESAGGFPSFYSYIPDKIIGMNNYLYTFKQGNLYRHNVNSVRNSYYDLVAESLPSSITSVFNASSLENKLFKTISLESDDAWKAALSTDIQSGANIDSTFFEKKEGAWYAYIRNVSSPYAAPAAASEYDLRSLNGIGNSSNIQAGVPAAGSATISFALTTNIGSILSIGDYFYYAPLVAPGPPPTHSAPVYVGQVTAININLSGGINDVIIDTSPPPPSGGTQPLPANPAFFLYIKNLVAESHGILGHYCEFTLTNESTTATELYAVEAQVMKSYP
jgi:hypothetical protein